MCRLPVSALRTGQRNMWLYIKYTDGNFALSKVNASQVPNFTIESFQKFKKYKILGDPVREAQIISFGETEVALEDKLVNERIRYPPSHVLESASELDLNLGQQAVLEEEEDKRKQSTEKLLQEKLQRKIAAISITQTDVNNVNTHLLQNILHEDKNLMNITTERDSGAEGDPELTDEENKNTMALENIIINIKTEKVETLKKSYKKSENNGENGNEKRKKKFNKKNENKNLSRNKSKNKIQQSSTDKENSSIKRKKTPDNYESSKKFKEGPTILSSETLINPVKILKTLDIQNNPDEILKITNRNVECTGESSMAVHDEQKSTIYTSIDEYNKGISETESIIAACDNCEKIQEELDDGSVNVYTETEKENGKKKHEKSKKIKRDRSKKKGKKKNFLKNKKESSIQIARLNNIIQEKHEQINALKKENEVLRLRNDGLQDKILVKIDEYAARSVNPFALECLGDIPIGFIDKEKNQIYCGFKENICLQAYYKAVNSSMTPNKLKTKDKGYAIFVKDVAESIISREVLKECSVKGRKCNSIRGAVAKTKIDDNKILAVKEIFKYYLVQVRGLDLISAEMEVGSVNGFIASKISDINKLYKPQSKKEKRNKGSTSKEIEGKAYKEVDKNADKNINITKKIEKKSRMKKTKN